jgi:chemotaxis protein MotB
MEAYNDFQQLADNVAAYIKDNELSASMEIDRDSFILFMRVDASVFFNPGDATLRAEAKPVLDGLVDLLANNEEFYSLVRIEGHTDNRAIHTAQYPSNWELSAFRAVNTLHYIIDSGQLTDYSKLSANGYSEYRPIDTNDTEEGRAKNRRVEFVIEGIRIKT